MGHLKISSLAVGLFYLALGLGAAIPPRDSGEDDIPALKEAIALKLSTPLSSISRRQEADGADIVEDLINKALQDATSSKTPKRDTSKFTVLPLITSLSASRVAELVQLAAERDPTYEPVNFGRWFQVQFADAEQSDEGTAPEEIVDLLRSLAGYDEVQSVQRLGVVVAATPPPQVEAAAVEPSDDPLFANQGYLKDDAGINAQYAWGFPGGDGAGTTLIDVERGWHLEHEDLIARNITLLAGNNVRAIRGFGLIRPHGTAVLGELFMQDNSVGGVGIVPGAQGHVVGLQRTVGGGPVESAPDAIMDAISFLSAGDALLLELQAGDFNGTLHPIEILDAEFDAIRTATALGITVIEPAANGGADLDVPIRRFVDEQDPRAFLNPASPDFRDSGAIIVGAGSPTAPAQRTRLSFSGFGARVDVHAWGESVATANTTAEEESIYTQNFPGTSAAAPIVAGAVLSIQGMLAANGRAKLTPAEMREMIVVGGTSTSNPDVDLIGVQPNLRAIIDGGLLN